MLPALCCYDYCLTLGDEILYVWRKRLSISTLLFCGIRYPAVINTVFMILGLNSWPSWQSNHVRTSGRSPKSHTDRAYYRGQVMVFRRIERGYAETDYSASCMVLVRTEMVLNIILLTSAAGTHISAL